MVALKGLLSIVEFQTGRYSKQRVFAVNERKLIGKDEECRCSMAGVPGR